MQSIVAAVERTNRAAFQQSFQSFDAISQFAALHQPKIQRFTLIHTVHHSLKHIIS
jgi:hypothetical protein